MGEETTFSMQQIKEILKLQEETMLNFIKITVERFDNKIDDIKSNIINIKRDIEDVKRSVEFTDGEASDLKKKVNVIEGSVKNISVPSIPHGTVIKMESLIKDNSKMVEKITDLEDRSRRNNLRINGIVESENETPAQTESKIINLFKNKLKIDKEIVIERCHRSGSKTYRDGVENKKRVIVMKLLNFKDKELVINAFVEKKIWDDNIYINEDFSERTLGIRKELFNTAKDIRKQGKYAKVVYNRLVTKDREDEIGN